MRLQSLVLIKILREYKIPLEINFIAKRLGCTEVLVREAVDRMPDIIKEENKFISLYYEGDTRIWTSPLRRKINQKKEKGVWKFISGLKNQ